MCGRQVCSDDVLTARLPSRVKRDVRGHGSQMGLFTCLAFAWGIAVSSNDDTCKTRMAVSLTRRLALLHCNPDTTDYSPVPIDPEHRCVGSPLGCLTLVKQVTSPWTYSDTNPRSESMDKFNPLEVKRFSNAKGNPGFRRPGLVKPRGNSTSSTSSRGQIRYANPTNHIRVSTEETSTKVRLHDYTGKNTARKSYDMLLQGHAVVSPIEYTGNALNGTLDSLKNGSLRLDKETVKEVAGQLTRVHQALPGSSIYETVSWLPLTKDTFPLELGTKTCPHLKSRRNEPCSRGKSSRRRFVVGDRQDMNQTMRTLLQSLGLCPAADLGDADVYWANDISDEWTEVADYTTRSGVHDGMIVGSIKGFKEAIGEKRSLAQIHARCLEKTAHDPHSQRILCRFAPHSFNFRVRDKTWVYRPPDAATEPTMGSANRAQLMALVSERFESYYANKETEESKSSVKMPWILKPALGWNSANISFVALGEDDLKDVAKFSAWLKKDIKLFPGEWTLQEFVHPPLVFTDRKFDIRLWAVVTSLDPFRMFIMKRAIPKIASKPYDFEHPEKAPKCALFRMMMTQGCHGGGVVRPYPKHTETLGFQRLLHFHQRPGRVITQDWELDVWPEMIRQLQRAVLQIRDDLLAEHDEIEAAVKYKRFMFLSPDISLDNQGRAKVIDLNTNGYMVAGGFFGLIEQLKAGMQIVGVDGYPLTSSEEQQIKMNAALDSFCRANNGCKVKGKDGSQPGRQVLEELMHEQAHACGWERMFPTAVHVNGATVSELKKAGLFRATPLDKLTWAFIKSTEFKEWESQAQFRTKPMLLNGINLLENEKAGH